MRCLSVVLLLLCSPLYGFGAAYTFDFNANCRKAYQRYMALDPAAAARILKEERALHPGNLIPAYLDNYSDCLELLFNGDKTKYEQWKERLDTRLEAIEQGDEHNPWYRFCKANLYLHWALANIRFGDNFKAAAKFRKSFLLLRENKELFPAFEENKVMLGLEQAIAGAIPDNYKWVASVFGVRGDVKKGVAAIVAYLNAHPEGQAPLYDEAAIYYAYLKFYLLAHQELAWKYVNGTTFPTEQNLMRSFVKANLALNYRKADIALKTLQAVVTEEQAQRYPILDYETGEALLLRMNFSCVTYFQRFLNNYRGKPFVKDAWQKLAWTAYLQNNTEQTKYYLQQLSNNGDRSTDADKQAQRFAEQKAWPLKELLEVRLLIDGGFYKQALDKMQSISKNALTSPALRLEYNFRYGRIFEELGNEDKAFLFYKATVQDGRDRKEYFAARAALQMGFLYEKAGKKTEAMTQFRDCLSMRDHDFQSSIDQQAKAALNRLGA